MTPGKKRNKNFKFLVPIERKSPEFHCKNPTLQSRKTPFRFFNSIMAEDNMIQK